MDNNKPIKDNPSTKKLRDEMESMSAFIKVGKVFGLTKNIDVPDMGQMIKDLDNLAGLPDEFNGFFANKGWIAYESFHVPTMQKAVDLMKSGDTETAEDTILDYYKDSKMIRMMIVSRGTAVEAYKPRKQLALYALDEYENGRYYSCVPLLLMIIDGIVNDISKATGFFADKTDLTSWDSIAGHYTGLTQLKNIYNQSRKKTNTDEIFMPYRNGILHGRDLNYNNVYVAAKCWGCLGAVLDWGKDIANGKKDAPPPEKPKTILENLQELKSSIDSMNETQKTKNYIEKWKSRNIVINKDIPEYGDSSAYTDKKKKKAVVEFLELINKKNYGYMFKRMHGGYIGFGSEGSQIKDIRKDFSRFVIDTFQIVEVNDCAPAISEVRINITFSKGTTSLSKECKFRLIYENERQSAVYGFQSGDWKIVYGYNDILYAK
jgi:hypothetical protein